MDMLEGSFGVDSNGRARVHLVKWEKVTQVKGHGELGIRRMHNMNKAFMAKLGWKILNDKGRLWVQVLSRKYIWGEVDISKLDKSNI